MAKKVRVTKLNDGIFEGKHPNGIHVGYTRTGIEVRPPEIGQRYTISTGKSMWDVFSTSPLFSLPNEEGVFTTSYSTYKLEYLED